MISRRLQIFEKWSVHNDSGHPDRIEIRGVQQWESRMSAAFGAIFVAQLSVILVPLLGWWVVAAGAALVLSLLFAHRFILVVTPAGAVCVETIFLVPISITPVSLDCHIGLYEDDWEGPDHPIGIEIFDRTTNCAVLIGPSNDLAAQNALRSVVEQAFRRSQKLDEGMRRSQARWRTADNAE